MKYFDIIVAFMKSRRLSHGIIILLGDAAIFFGTLFLALWVRNLALPQTEIYVEHVQVFVILFVLYEVTLYIAGFWGKWIIPSAKNIFNMLAPAHLLATIIMILFFYLLPSLGISPKTNLIIFTSLLFVLMFIWKMFGLRIFAMYPSRAILIGPEKDLEEIFADQPLWSVKICERLNPMAGLHEIEEALEQHKTDTVLVSLDRYPRIDILYKLIFSNVSVVNTTSLREEVTLKVDLDKIDHNWFITHIQPRGTTYRLLKRFVDIIVAVGMGVFTVFILTPIIFAAIKTEDGGPILIKQKRMGLRGREFNFYKFRSMTTNDGDWKNKHDKKRITRVGAVLRKTRIDEMAQWWNILRGDISIVGPRAILVNEHETLCKHNPFQQARLLAQPGLTGWAQVQQKYAPANEEEADIRLAYDLYYIKNISLWLDIQIMMKTIKKVIDRVGMRQD